MAVLALGACSDDDGGDTTSGSSSGSGSGSGSAAEAPPTIEEGTLTVCSDIPYEPFEFEGDGPSGYTGFDIDLLAAVAETSSLELSVSDVDFDGILGNLAADSCDVVASAVTITDERAEQVDFTESYFDADQSLLVKTDTDIAGLDDLDGKTIGVQSGTTGETYAKDNTPDGAEVKSFEGADALFAAIESGDIDAILQDFPVNAYRATQDDSVDVVEEYTTDEAYGFAVKKGNTELLDALNAGLTSVRDDGDYDTIYEEYFGDAPK
ncbi:basic amino acid ABC transporter substrate-binding protein [soil metagenome]